MSRAIVEAPMTVPFASRSGDERDFYQAPILAAPDRFIVAHALAAAQPRQDRCLFILPIVRQEKHDRLSDDLGGAIAEQQFRPPVPARDGSIQILRQNGVVGGFDDRG
jgi:hypothetical protein